MLLFPNGIAYDFETGFGTIEKIKSYPLIDELSKNNAEKTDLVIPAGFEPAISWMRTKCPKPLDDGTLSINVHYTYAELILFNTACVS